jgi:superfamily II DNA or RNA helicase
MPVEQFSPGQIVKARSRLWRIDDTLKNVLVVTSIDGTPVQTRKLYLPLETVSLAKIDPPLAERVGNYAAQDLMIRAFKLSMIHGTAPLLSLQRSRVVPELFQMVPVVISLDMPRVRMLIADDVGLGKTIEAGLIISELFARQRASKLLIVCPANLREQWQEALDYFFHIDARIISSQHRRALERELPPGSNPWEYYPYLIVSMDYAKEPQIKAQILEQPWDIVVIDEAHNVAKPHQIDPHSRPEMARWELARDLSPKTKHLLLLTATPHNGFTDSFASLLEMLNVGAVTGPSYSPTIIRSTAKNYVCQRRRKDVEAEFKSIGGESPFPERDQREVFVTLNDYEKRAIAKVEELGRHILDTAGSERPYGQRLAKWTVTHFHKRALSSPRALVISLQNRLQVINQKLGKGLPSIGEESAVREEEARAAVLDNDTGERLNEEDTGLRLERRVSLDLAALKREQELIEHALVDAKKVSGNPRELNSRDSKLNHLLDNTLREMMRKIPKAIIFSKYRDTVNYLAEQIPLHRNYGRSTKVVIIDGTLDESERKERFRDFASADRAVLLATDAISEGINLQYIASQIIHYELPWNPNRLEQRNGRIDRYGQPEKTVVIRTMVVDDSLEAAILKVLVEKAYRIRQDHGFSPPFFEDDISILDLIRERGLEVSIAQTKLSDFLEDVSPKQVPDPFSDDAIKRMEDENFYGQTRIDLTEVKKRQDETESLVGSKKEIEKFVKSGLNRFGCEITENKDGTCYINVRDERLLAGLEGAEIKRASFDALRSRGDTDVDIIDLGHPLVRNLIELVKDSTFTSLDYYGRTASITTSVISKTSAVYSILARYAVKTSPVSVLEELLHLGVELGSGRSLSEEEVRDLLNSKPLADLRTEQEIKEDLGVALSRDKVQLLIEQRAEERCAELMKERAAIKASLEERGGEKDWLTGIDQISVASVDLLSVTIYYPAPGVATR